MRSYTVVLSWDEEDGGWGVEVPAIPGCYSQGDTVEEALEHAREAIEGFLEVLAMEGEDPPAESRPPQLHRVEVAEAAKV